MCLTITVPVKVLKRARRYYKVVSVEGDEFYSPYRNTPIKLGRDYYYSPVSIDADVTIRKYENLGAANIVLNFGSGLFHLYRNKRSAKRHLNSMKETYPALALIIVEAMVPKGSLVFVDSALREEIATNHVRYYRNIM